MSEFLKHVKNGLSQTQKKLSSRYFYDKKGDELFRQIMKTEEYYLPACEMNIIHNKSKHVAKAINQTHQDLQIVELGAGDGSKTKYLLKEFTPHFQDIEYVALDISPHVLTINAEEIYQLNPSITTKFIAGNYFQAYPNVPAHTGGRLVLFLGANIGNFSIEASVDFFRFVNKHLQPKDYFLVAFDLVKNPRKILGAYDDKEGVTKAFNLNLLSRINQELGANFDLDKFDHFPFYNPITGITSSQIISLEKQEVSLPDGTVFHFDAYEAIHTEISKKYFHSDIEKIASESGITISQYYYDDNKEYTFVLFQSNL